MRTITLKLTLAEAKALDFAVGNSIGNEDDAEAIFQDKRARKTAYRAAQKLSDAIKETLRTAQPKDREGR